MQMEHENYSETIYFFLRPIWIQPSGDWRLEFQSRLNLSLKFVNDKETIQSVVLTWQLQKNIVN